MTSETPESIVAEYRVRNHGERYMEAYWYSFTPTGIEAVDDVLEAVAIAGKRFHHTDEWRNPMCEIDVTNMELIQSIADAAAAKLMEATDD